MYYPDHIWQLMARVLHKEADTEEYEAFAKMLEEYPELQQQFELVNRLWHSPNNAQTDESDAQATVRKIISKANGEEHAHFKEIQLFDLEIAKRRRRRMIWMAAASVLAVLSF